MIAHRLYSEVRRRGFDLVVRGGKLVVTPKRPVPPELLTRLRAHKAELLALLGGQAASLQADQAPWLHIARQVLAGEFDGANDSLVQSVTIGLRSIRHPLCQQALDRIKTHQPHQREPAVACTGLLGSVVEIGMIGYGGKWLVVRDEGGPKVWVQRPQDFKPKWVLRRYIKAPNTEVCRGHSEDGAKIQPKT